MSATLAEPIRTAVKSGQFLEASARNLARLLAGSTNPLYVRCIKELVEAGHWSELNDRFFTTLAFGTGGLRGRTIGKVVTKTEQGGGGPLGRPEFPCVGTNAMNYYNVARATRGLVAYLRKYAAERKLPARPKLVVAHDPRHFSAEFCALVANVATENGCDVIVFDGPRSTPELSFAVRHTNATAGIVITASHNPPHDNGYKVYFADGAQIIEPHASAIIAEVNAIEDEAYEPLPAGARGTITTVSAEVDTPYLERLKTLVIDPAMLASQRDLLKIVFTPIHGPGSVISRPALEALGIPHEIVAEQDTFDGRFPTVKSPNPENAEALSLGMALAKSIGADAVVATDPDADRMGAAFRTTAGSMEIITGNQIGSLFAYYRTKSFFDRGILTEANKSHACIVKTFVTTDLQRAIAQRYGLRCVETLTGFKYIGAKLGKYEAALPDGARANYRAKSEEETRALRLAESTFLVFGGEESYGYTGADFVRDKDANAATIMFAEVCAYAKSRGLTIGGLLDEIYASFGYYDEKNGAIQMDGAEGAARIQKLLASYELSPPATLGADRVVEVRNFARQKFHDVEGDLIPPEKMLLLDLESGGRVAVRGSGTEPKIKFYLFARSVPAAGEAFTVNQLATIKTEVKQRLGAAWAWLQADADQRLA